MEVKICYLCDGKACGEVCPNDLCHHTYQYSHALNKDADLDTFERMPLGDGVVVLWEPYDE